jgi:hypothetical protein
VVLVLLVLLLLLPLEQLAAARTWCLRRGGARAEPTLVMAIVEVYGVEEVRSKWE